MSTQKTGTAGRLIVYGVALLLPLAGQAWEPNAAELDSAIQTGDLKGYQTDLSAWLSQKALAGASRITEASMTALLKDPIFAGALAQRHFISKVGPDQLGTFGKTDDAHKAFVTWLLKNSQALELYLDGATPVKIAAREDNSWSLSVGALETWRRIYEADPSSKEGLYLRLAMATALRPPGTGAPGAGQQKTPSDPVVRYTYYKTAHAKKELFPSFEKLTVWELQYVVSSGASEADLTWGREMINTWRPDLRINESVVESTSQVWRRNSPIPFDNGYRSVLEGGGKCGPRSSWSVFICQAFGIPAIGVGQPAHACVAYKAFDPAMEPQPGSIWKVGYGRGWDVSKLEGMSGPEFVAGVEARAQTAVFSQVEHLRWLAAALASKEQAAAVLSVARELAQSAPVAKTDLKASLKAEEMDANPGAKPGTVFAAPKAKEAPQSTAMPEAPFQAVPGVIHVEAESFAKEGGEITWGGQKPGVFVYDCFTGGKQVNFQANMKSAWVDYTIEIPTTGTYEVTMRVAVVNREQVLELSSGATRLATVNIANTYGSWATTEPVEVKLAAGTQTLRISTPFERGIALRWFELKMQGSTK